MLRISNIRLTLYIIVFLTSFVAQAKEHPILMETKTIHEKRTYINTSHFSVNASPVVVDAVMEKFIHDLDTDPESLFDNILKGLGTDEDEEKAEENARFSVDFKSCVFDSAHNYYVGTLDFYIGSITIHDIKLYGRITKATNRFHESKSRFELLSNALTKVAYADIEVADNKNGGCNVSLHSEFKFSWITNLFFNDKNYKNIAEWRIDKFMQNFKKEIEKAQQKE